MAIQSIRYSGHNYVDAIVMSVFGKMIAEDPDPAPPVLYSEASSAINKAGDVIQRRSEYKGMIGDEPEYRRAEVREALRIFRESFGLEGGRTDDRHIDEIIDYAQTHVPPQRSDRREESFYRRPHRGYPF
jgi:hypothetical protein